MPAGTKRIGEVRSLSTFGLSFKMNIKKTEYCYEIEPSINTFSNFMYIFGLGMN